MGSKQYCLLIGNSRWHWAAHLNHEWKFFDTLPEPEKIHSIKKDVVAWAAVGPMKPSIALDEQKQITTLNVPLINMPKWIGVDRALGALGAYKKATKDGSIKPNGLLVADAGTVLSITRINESGEFIGGQLVGGFNLQLSAMAHGAKNLFIPDSMGIPKSQFPSSTSDAMLKGSIQALLGIILETQREENITIWLCGGDSPLLLEQLQKHKIQVKHRPNLVVEGMLDIKDHIKSRSVRI